MPMGIDNDYDGVGNEADDTPNGDPAALKVKQLLEALANLLGGNESPLADAAPPMPAVGGMPGEELGETAPPTGGDPVMGLMSKLKGMQAPAAVDSPPPLPPDEGEDQSAIENDMRGGKSFPEANPDVPATAPKNDAKGAMSKLAKLRGGK